MKFIEGFERVKYELATDPNRFNIQDPSSFGFYYDKLIITCFGDTFGIRLLVFNQSFHPILGESLTLKPVQCTNMGISKLLASNLPWGLILDAKKSIKAV